MRPYKSKRVETFNDRYPLVGPAFWMVSVQFFVVMSLVASWWPIRYSAFQNTISDLGNTACGVYAGRYVCSPGHAWMNASFMLLGTTMAVGSVLIYHEFRKSFASAIGFVCMALAGLGTVLVGIFAENTNTSLHEFSAALPFVAGNVALIILGFALDMPRTLRVYTHISGTISLLAFGLFATHHYLGLGIGGTERLIAHPQTIWLIVFGAYMSKDRYREQLLTLRARTRKA